MDVRKVEQMRVSISLSNYSWPVAPSRLGPELLSIARTAEQVGVDTVWVPDHLIQADPTVGPGEDEMLETYTVLGFLAAGTERIGLGAMVSPVTMRLPAVLVKTVTTLDVLSGGRAWLGIGAGYHAEEAADMGLPLPDVATRFEQLEETLQIADRMWAGDDARFAGRHFQLDRPVGSPLPVRRPPILIGGDGERRTLRLVARYGDACNLFDIPDGGATVRHKLEVLAGHCRDVGRPFEAVTKTMATRLHVDESSGSFADRGKAAAELGIDHLVVVRPKPWDAEALTTLGAAIEELDRVEPAPIDQ